MNISEYFKRMILRTKTESAAEQERTAVDLECMRIINILRQPEGWSVNIICDNPDFIGDNNAVVIFGEWSFTAHGASFEWVDRTFYGSSLLDALNNALKEARHQHPKRFEDAE